MNITPYTPPDFLQNSSVDDIYNRMVETAPEGIDVEEGSMFFDATYPVALEKAEMVQFKLNETVKIIFPQWAYGMYLIMHAEKEGIPVKYSTPAYYSGYQIKGVPGTPVPAGFRVSTPSVNDLPSIEFYTKTDVVLDVNGDGTVAIEAVVAGVSGNVAENTITMMVKPLKGITSVTNPGKTTGGTAGEDEETLRQRILEIKQLEMGSGSKSDYKRWAEEIPGIGKAIVIPEWQGAGTGTVKVIVVDLNGEPANEQLVAAVKNYIEPDDGSGLAPIGAHVTITAPTGKALNYVFTLTLFSGYDQSDIITAFKNNLREYYKEVGVEGEIVYTKVGAILSDIPGVKDYAGLTINGGTVNIQLAIDEYPVTGTVNGA